MQNNMKDSLTLVMDVGEQMLLCGAEVHRVEDSVSRMCTALGAARVDCFIITSSMVVTLHEADGSIHTETRRIRATGTNFHRLERLNALSRTVEVQENQTVISTGLYGIVRHPMYLATLLMFLPLPLILGSFWGLLPFALYPAVIVIRIVNEERVLTAGLDGYAAYKTKVKYRLIPFLW